MTFVIIKKLSGKFLKNEQKTLAEEVCKGIKGLRPPQNHASEELEANFELFEILKKNCARTQSDTKKEPFRLLF